MAAFIQDLQATFDATVRAVRASDPVSSLFQSDGPVKHFKPSDAHYIIGDFIGVVGASSDPASSRRTCATAGFCPPRCSSVRLPTTRGDRKISTTADEFTDE
jgi:hypothetical protein